MSALAAICSLRISQGILTAANLGLASYLVHEMADVASSVTIALVAACVSAIGICCAPSSSNITSTKPSYLPFALAVDWVVSFVNMIALSSLGMFVMNSSLCQEKICTVAKVQIVLTGFNFVNWAATAMYIGIRISERGAKGTTCAPETGKIRI